MPTHVLVTGGAGYIGSALVARLLKQGNHVTVLDDLWFGGESILPFLSFDSFRLIKSDISANGVLLDAINGIDCVIHLAAIVGFPACEKAGRTTVWKINVEATKKIYSVATRAGVSRFIFMSSYSNYGESEQGEPVTEESSLYPKSIYAESKIEAERFILGQTDALSTAPICLRLATAFGVSPRMRFDLIVNQFVLEAFAQGRLELYQENFKRSFVHVQDIARAIILVMKAPLAQVRNQVFNVGSEYLNTSKLELVKLIQFYLPQLKVQYLDKSFEGDMRSLHMSFKKIRKVLQFKAQVSLETGVEELLWALQNGIISDPLNAKYRNHPAILV